MHGTNASSTAMVVVANFTKGASTATRPKIVTETFMTLSEKWPRP